jgi:hypothetical protein
MRFGSQKRGAAKRRGVVGRGGPQGGEGSLWETPPRTGAADDGVRSLRASRRERGASLTEFAIVAPLFIAIIYGSLYLCDLGVFRLKAQEIARYGAWAFTERPLSNYGDESFRHSVSFSEARDDVMAELLVVYDDLDGAHTSLPGASAKTMSAAYLPPTSSDFKNREVQLVPAWANASFAGPLSTLWWILQFVQIGGDVNDLVNGPAKRMKLNEMGQVTAEASVVTTTPLVATDASQAAEMARVGASRGADLSRWKPRGRTIRDRPGRDIQTTLIADSWKVTQGWSTWPGGDFTDGRDDTHYGNVVQEVSNRGISALPLGPIIQFVMSVAGLKDKLPSTITTAIAFATGIPRENPSKHVMSRPYSAPRRYRPTLTTESDLQPGQAEIFSDTEAEPQEDDAVMKFETGPLYSDPEQTDNEDANPYLKALNRRGPYFMGCDHAETRGCWDTR